MKKRARYSYFVQVTEKIHKAVSAKEWKELSRHWDAGESDGVITKYYVDEIEVGRIVKKA